MPAILALYKGLLIYRGIKGELYKPHAWSTPVYTFYVDCKRDAGQAFFFSNRECTFLPLSPVSQRIKMV